MIGNTLQVLRWCASLGRKFTTVVPAETIAVVASTLVSQLGLLLATFLPLKIVILLGSEGVPRYFPSSFASIDRDLLVGLLCAATGLFFVVHVLAERVINFSSERGARQLLERSQKLTLFESQDEMATNAYQQYARALAGAVFALLVFVVLMLVYPEMALVLGVYTVLTIVSLHLVAHLSNVVRMRIADKLKIVTSVAGNIGFLTGFVWLVIDFLFYTPPSLLPAIIALLLSRLALTRVAGMVADVAALKQKRTQLDALFFHGKALVPASKGSQDSIWTLLEPQRRVDWVQPALQGVGVDSVLTKSGGIIHWHQLRAPNAAALMVESEGSSHILVKLFDRVRRGAARHEADLMAAGVVRLPAPEWLSATSVDGYPCHLMAVDAGAESLPSGRFKKYQVDLVGQLLAVEPPEGLVQRFRRSRPQLHQRMSAEWFERLLVAVEGDDRLPVVRLLERIEAIRNALRALPAVIVNPDLTAENMLLVNGQAIAVHWGDWAIEPAGCGWPVQSSALKQLDAAVAGAADQRDAFVSVSPEAVRVAALMYAMERRLRLPRLADALQLIPSVERSLNAFELGEAESAQES